MDSTSHLPSPENHAPLFIFGDSLFDTGNNNNPTSSACYWPYGETFFKHPTGRASDGRLIPDFIAEYAKLPFPLPYRQTRNRQLRYGVNFASGGAEVLGVNPDKIVIHLKGQLSNFKNVKKRLRHKLGDSETEALLSKAIYLFSFGTNDYGKVTDGFSVLHYYSSEEYVGMVVDNFTTGIKEFYKKGGRRFGFVNIGPYGCAPFTRALSTSGGCLEEATALIKLHNKEVSKALEDLEQELEGFEYSVQRDLINQFFFKIF
ncbi:GDSL esterase/lipase 1-like [Manihot esculenta]|uniref:GDSL esterase/lipase 1-like n=1 Tax=Manihot esculenta TaxID=3983 RepID=UPI001CC7EEAB|nr:GDSL esterase/lipase 1-like [Manihot esculenta]